MYPWISNYKNLILQVAYPKTTFLSLLIPGYLGISHKAGYPAGGSTYPWISQYKPGYGRVSLFQMTQACCANDGSGNGTSVTAGHCE